jgi:hypothetical protein
MGPALASIAADAGRAGQSVGVLQSEARGLDSIVRSVGASTTGLSADLARVSATAVSASSSFSDLGGAIGRIDAPTVQTGGIDSFGDSAKKAGGSTKAFGAALSGVATQMPDVISQLSMGASPIQILIQQGLQVVQSTEGLGAAFSAIAGPLAIATVAAASLGTAYVVLKNHTEAAAEASGRVVARANEAATALNRARQAVIDTSMAWGAFQVGAEQSEIDLGVLTGQLDKYSVTADRQIVKLEEQARAGILASSVHVQSIGRQIDANKDLIRSEAQTVLEKEKLKQANAKLRQEQEAAQKVLDERLGALEKGRQVIRDSAEYSRELAAEEDRLAKAKDRTSKSTDLQAQRERLLNELRQVALRGLSEERRHLAELQQELASLAEESSKLGIGAEQTAAAFKQLGVEILAASNAVELAATSQEFDSWAAGLVKQTQMGTDALAGFYSTLSRTVPAPALSALDQLTIAEIELEAAQARGIVTAGQAEEAMSSLASAREQLAKSSRLELTTGIISSVSGGAGTAIQTGLTALGASSGVVGAAGAAVGLLNSSASGDLAENFLGSFKALGDGLRNLPGELGEILKGVLNGLPSILSKGIPAFTEALVAAVPALLGAILNPELWVNLTQALARGVFNAGKLIVQGLADAVRALLSRDFWRDVGRSLVDALIDLITGKSRREARREDRASGRNEQSGASSSPRYAQQGSTSRQSGQSQSGALIVNVGGSMLGNARDLERSMKSARRRGALI